MRSPRLQDPESVMELEQTTGSPVSSPVRSLPIAANEIEPGDLMPAAMSRVSSPNLHNGEDDDA
jgi:hypothetical protein